MWPLDVSARSVTVAASSATLTSGPAPWSGSATSAITDPIKADASSAGDQEYQTLTTAKNAPYKRRIETDVQRSSIWEVQKQTSSMSGRNMDSKKDDEDEDGGGGGGGGGVVKNPTWEHYSASLFIFPVAMRLGSF